MSRNKKISSVVGNFPSITGTFVTNQIIAAINAGYIVKVYARQISPSQESSQENLIKQYNLLNYCIPIQFSFNKIKRLKQVLKILSKKGSPAFYLLFQFIKACRFGFDGLGVYNFLRTASFLGDDSYIYHAQFGSNGRLLVEARQAGVIKGKIITTFHGIDASSSNFLTTEELKKYYQALFRTGDLFTANTPYLAEQVASLGCPRDKLQILPMGVDTSFFRPKKFRNSIDNTVKLLSVGRLISWKSFDLGIMAVQELISEGLSIHYTIIGDGNQKGYLFDLVERQGLTSHVTFTGTLNQQKVRDYMQNNDIFLMTSTYDENFRREAQGVVTVEAQACGLPICAFRSGGVPYTVSEGETGFLAEEKDLQAFTKNLRIIVENDELRNEMSRKARAFVEKNFSMDVCSNKLIQIYQSMD
ncbi:MAG: glycosyltransferase [bacterium]